MFLYIHVYIYIYVQILILIRDTFMWVPSLENIICLITRKQYDGDTVNLKLYALLNKIKINITTIWWRKWLLILQYQTENSKIRLIIKILPKKKSHHSIRKNDDFFRTDNSISGNFFFAKNEFSSSVEVEFEIVNITFRRMEKVVNTAN